MTHTDGAKVLSVEEIKELMDEEYTNPTVDRLMFVETRGKDGQEGKLFPIYFEAWGYLDWDTANVKANPDMLFKACIVQSTGGEFGMVRVSIKMNDIGVTKRIWDKPPTSGLRRETLWPDEIQVQ